MNGLSATPRQPLPNQPAWLQTDMQTNNGTDARGSVTPCSASSLLSFLSRARRRSFTTTRIADFPPGLTTTTTTELMDVTVDLSGFCEWRGTHKVSVAFRIWTWVYVLLPKAKRCCSLHAAQDRQYDVHSIEAGLTGSGRSEGNIQDLDFSSSYQRGQFPLPIATERMTLP